METEAIFHDTIGIMAVITMVPVFFIWLERTTRWKIFNILPAIIWIFMTPVLLSFFGVIPHESPVYDQFKALAVPIFIVLMLLDIDIRRAVKVAWRGAGVLVLGSFGIVVGAVSAFALFRSGLPENTGLGFGALAGSWIGGTGNLAAVAEGLNTPSEMVGLVVLVDNFIYLLYFPIILTSKRWAGWFNRFTKVSLKQMKAIADSVNAVEKKSNEVHFRDILTLLGFGFTGILVAQKLSEFLPTIPPVMTGKTWAILLVTTIGILLSATPLKKVAGSEPVAMTFVYIYMTMIGAQADLSKIGGATWFLVAGAFCIIIHFAFIVIGARIFRVDVSMAAVASVAAVGGAASAPVAAAYHREDLVPVSIMLALLGYGLGNYLGIATGWLCMLMA
ncbi:MAG: DUF819 family protein [Acidobacteria bacterium]|nr:MAG: DUF819 family protein [Acidobacteriota bacterium]